MRHESERVEYEKEKALMKTKLKQMEEYSEPLLLLLLFLLLLLLLLLLQWSRNLFYIGGGGKLSGGRARVGYILIP